jgi:hypothetical protein
LLARTTVAGQGGGWQGDGFIAETRELMLRGPLAGRYAAVAAMVMLAVIPFLALFAALEPLAPIIADQFHMSAQMMSLGSGLSNAAYAAGTVPLRLSGRSWRWQARLSALG